MKKLDTLKFKMAVALEAMPARSAWKRGVKNYAVDLLDNIESLEAFSNVNLLKNALLNGADNWEQYSWDGCALCYDQDIATALCTPSELKKKDGGRLAPNSRETWLDVQTRALYQAERLILKAYRTAEIQELVKEAA